MYLDDTDLFEPSDIRIDPLYRIFMPALSEIYHPNPKIREATIEKYAYFGTLLAGGLCQTSTVWPGRLHQGCMM